MGNSSMVGGAFALRAEGDDFYRLGPGDLTDRVIENISVDNAPSDRGEWVEAGALSTEDETAGAEDDDAA